jgi:8-amino-3,8-dideoxy-alpha-D-manno-octulosonate transaminase
MAHGPERLAIEGGPRVRTRPFPKPYWGAAVVGEEELALVTEVVRSKCLFRDYGDGTPHMVNDFEREARAYLGANYALAVTSGSAALYCAMAALGIGPGDEVITPSLIWRSDFQAPLAVGAAPVLVEIDRSLSVDPAELERAITPRTKAVIVVHFQGGVGDLDAVLAIAKARGIAVIEDCAQSFGASYRGRKIGSLGDVGCFSLQHNKVLTTGDGGLVTTRDPVAFERAVRYHDLGLFRSALKAQAGNVERVPEFSGLQFRMNELTGAVALAQLRNLDRRVLDVTRGHSRRLRAQLRQDCPGMKFRQAQDETGDAGIAFYMDLEQGDRAQEFSKALTAEGLQLGATTRVCNLLTESWVLERRQAHPALPPFGPGAPGASVQYRRGQCPRTDAIIASFVCVPITPLHTEEDMEDIRRAIVKVWRGLGAQ